MRKSWRRSSEGQDQWSGRVEPKGVAVKMFEEYSQSKLFYHLGRVAELVEGEDIFPITVEFNVTNVCNYRCPWCSETKYRSRHANATLPWQVVVRSIKDMAKSGVRSVTIEGGGEPTVHPHFMNIAMADYYDIDLGLITNGSRLDKFPEEMYKRLAYVRVSLDAGDAKTYEAVHGVDAFSDVMSNMSWVAGINGRGTLGVSYVVSEDTLAGIYEAARKVKDAGADYIQFKPLLGDDMKIHYFEMGDALKAVKQFGDGTFKVYLTRFAAEEIGRPYGCRTYKFCRAHRLIGAVAATGEVLLCCNLKHKFEDDRFAFGNLNKKSFCEIWQGERRHKIINDVETDEEFLQRACGYCRMNEFNKMVEDYIENAEINPLWKFI